MRTKIVGVIFTRDDFARALRMRRPPDFFELRLDALLPHLDKIESVLPKLRAPLIITARHPREGGANALSAARCRKLLQRFLPYAAFVDIEQRFAQSMRSVLAAARHARVHVIVSIHDFQRTPSAHKLEAYRRDARELRADIVKIATRVERLEDVTRLLQLLETAPKRPPLAVMGMGIHGRASRVLFARRGSALTYCHLRRANADGQMLVAELRAASRR